MSRARSLTWMALGLSLALGATAAEAAIAFRSAASVDRNGSAGSITISRPPGTQKGDLMVAVIAVVPSSVTVTAPGGWSLVNRQTNTNGNSNALAVYYKVASAAEPASYTWTFSPNNGNAGGIMTFSGVDNASPIHAAAGQLTTSASTSIAAPSVTTTVADTMIVTGHEYAASRRWTAPAGMTEAFDVASRAVNSNGGVSTIGSYMSKPAVGPTGTLVATTGGNADTGAGITVALKPVVCGAAVSDAAYFVATAGNGTVVLAWSGASAVVVLRKSSPFTGEAPAPGVTYAAGDPVGAATVVYAGSASSLTESGLTNGTSYYYKIFAADGVPCYSPGTELKTRPEAGPRPAWSFTMAGGSMLNAGIAGSGTLYTSSNAGRVISLGTGDGLPSWAPMATTAPIQGSLTWLPTGGRGVRSLQSGTAAMAAGTSGAAQTVDVPIAAVDLTRAVLFFSVRGSSAEPGDGQVRGQITSATNVRFYRANDTSFSDLTVRWTVVEFRGAVRVQRGTSSVSNGGTIPIAAVDPAQSFVLASCSVASTDMTYGSDDFFRVRLLGATGLEIVHGTTAVKTCDWQVVEYQGAYVQRGTGTLAAGATTSGPVTIAAVDPARSLAQVTWRTSGDGSGPNLVRARLTGPTTLEVDRAATGTTIEYAWEVVEFADGTRVVPGTSSLGAAQTSASAAIAAVDPARSVAVLSAYQRAGRTAYASDDNVGPGWFTVALVDATTVSVERAIGGGAAADAAWFVVEFPDRNPVVLGGDQSGRVYAVDVASGTANWQALLTGADAVQAGLAAQLRAWSDAGFQAAHADDLIFAATRNASTTGNKVVALRAGDGSVAWTFNETGVYAMDYVVGMPWVDYGLNRLYVASRAGSSGTQPSLWVISTLDGTLLGSFALGHLETSPTVSLDASTVWVASTAGNLYAVDTATLTLKWSGPAALGAAVKGFVLEDGVVPGRLYFSTADGQVWCLQDPGPGAPPNPASPVWKRAVAGASTPLVLDKVYVGSSDGRLHQLDRATGVDEKQFVLGDGTATVGDPSTEDGAQVFAGTTAGTLYKVPLPLP
ncbi:MAG TPA: PQQ-binding-like beta-propeller repeat protein [Candidatus Binatia bacterium]|nr:PQQ-binding-like beta-propeller repeat protein [Candidatus Binatia bacterium]